MRNLIFIGIIIVCCDLLMSQTPFYIMKPVYVADELRIQGPSLKNTWVGSKLTLDLNEGLLRDNFVFSAKVLYTPLYGDNYAIPLVTSTALASTNIFNAESGVNIGVYPYYILKDKPTAIFVVHGGLGYKVIPKTADILLQEQVKISAGVEGLFYQKGFKAPTTLSITPSYYHNIQTNSEFGVELTGIIPIGIDMGFIVEYMVMKDGILKMGIIVNSL